MEAERAAQILAAAAAGPLFWALGFILASGVAHTLLAGHRPGRLSLALRWLLAAAPVAGLTATAALEAANAAGALSRLPLPDSAVVGL